MPTIADIRAQYPQYSDMQDNQLADALYGKFYSDMPREQFNTKIGLTQPAPPQAAPAADTGNMFSDVIPEIKNAATENINAIKNMYGGTAEKGVLQSQLDVGKGLMAIPGLMASPITGAARSLLGHPLASAEHAIGSAIAPEIAAKDDPQQMYEAAKGNVDTAMRGLAPRGASPLAIKTAAAPVPAAAELKSAATSVYNDPAVKSMPVNTQDLSNLSAKAINDLTQQGFRPTAKSASGTFEELNNLVPPSNVKAVTVDDVRSARMALQKYANETVDGKATPEAAAASQALGHIDSLLDRYSPALKEANANYRAYRQGESFDLRGQRAQNNADAANSGLNLENNIRQQVKQILNNPKLQRGYDADTLQALRQFNKGSRSANVLRYIGNLLGGGGGWGTTANMLIGHAIGGPAGAALEPAIGLAVKTAGNIRAAKQFDKLGQMIRSNSPLAQSRPPIPLPAPNPILSILAGRLSVPQILGMGIVPSRADQQRQ